MPTSPAVVLNCAGLGRRLGLGQTKALIEILGRPLIHWQLDLLTEITDLRVVVGYNAESVIEAVLARRRDAVFIFNRDYATNATGDSLLLAAEHIPADVVSLDGDLLVSPRDLQQVLGSPARVLGITPALSDQAIFVTLAEGPAGLSATGFSTQRCSDWEWTGLIKAPAAALVDAAAGTRTSSHHVYQLAEPMLPMSAVEIDSREIDTAADYDRAATWLAGLTSEGRWKHE